MSNVLGGALVPHAPQFFSLPDTEDKATVKRVETAMGELGDKLAALKPDVWIIMANDHANQFILHCTPPFCFHLGAEVKGSFVGREFRYKVASEPAMRLFQNMQEQGFDPAFTNTADIDYSFGIPLTFLKVNGPVIPIYVNSYIPPQPSMRRCFAFGEALARAADATGVKAVVIASGGMSHFPGTSRYSNPEVDFDRKVFETLKGGNLRSLLSLEERLLDDTGNVELRTWAIVAGALGERKADVAAFEPSWHHTYATLGFTTPRAERKDVLHYPAIAPERVKITQVLHKLSMDAAERQRWHKDPKAYAASLGLAPDEAQALADIDQIKFSEMGIHPLVPFLAHLQIDRERKAAKK